MAPRIKGIALGALAICILLAILHPSHAIVATILSISPTRGSLEGGTQVTLRGAGFSRGGIQVKFVIPAVFEVT